METPRFTVICCSVDPTAAEALRRNVAATIGEAFEFDAWDNRGRSVGLCEVYNRCAGRSAGEYLCFVHEDVRFLTEGWAARLPLSVEPLDDARLADLVRRAEAYFLKLLCQKRLFDACPFGRIARYVRTYPGHAASWALPFKYLKYHLKSLVTHG